MFEGLISLVSRVIHSFLKWKSFNCRKRSKSSHPALLRHFKFPNFAVKKSGSKKFFSNWKNRQCHPFRTCVSLEDGFQPENSKIRPEKCALALNGEFWSFQDVSPTLDSSSNPKVSRTRTRTDFCLSFGWHDVFWSKEKCVWFGSATWSGQIYLLRFTLYHPTLQQNSARWRVRKTLGFRLYVRPPPSAFDQGWSNAFFGKTQAERADVQNEILV